MRKPYISGQEMENVWNPTTKKRRKAISVPGVVTLLCLVAGCTVIDSGSGPVDFSMMETPSAIRYFEWGSLSNPYNLARRQLGAVRDSGDIFDITGLGGMSSYPAAMYPYPVVSLPGMPDLSGVAFTIDLNDQWGSGLFGDYFNEMLAYMYVLEFTFPEATYTNGTKIAWFVMPRLRCGYVIQESGFLVPSYEAPPLPFLWFEYVILEDPLGVYDLMHPNEAMIVALEDGIEHKVKYFFEGESDDRVAASNDQRSGTMIVDPGTEAKLFVGVSVLMSTEQPGDRIIIGGNSLPTTTSDWDRGTLDFGNNSYYTMRPVSDGSGGGGGGCSLSGSRQGGSILEYFLPYGVLAIFMFGLRRRDRRHVGLAD
jgi:hypothetical protein